MSLIIKDEQFIPIAKGLLETAKHTINISSFKMEISDTTRGKKLKQFFDLIIRKANEGVKVRALINWHDNRYSVPKTNEYAIKKFKQNNIKIRHLKANRCCHAKLIIVDNEKAIIGSHNLSIKSVTENFEISCLLSNIEDVKSLIAVYDEVWASALKS